MFNCSQVDSDSDFDYDLDSSSDYDYDTDANADTTVDVDTTSNSTSLLGNCYQSGVLEVALVMDTSRHSWNFQGITQSYEGISPDKLELICLDTI